MTDNLEEVTDGVHHYSKEESYVAPKEKALQAQLEWFKDQKIGVMMHWGPYSQLGVVESWALSDEDAEWSREEIDWEHDSKSLKQQYVALNKTFHPIRFQPDAWADLAKDTGFKYLVFTTKHHDGFAMWDTKTTEYKITGSACPFHRHPYADVCKQLFDAFRARGLGISAYFSKADWHIPSYWTPNKTGSGYTRRGPSYDPKEDPALWEQFVQFTHEQILELLTNYGRIDMLWLDAGWVSPKNNQDIRLGEVVEKARKTQPWLLAADRTVGGPYENILTPEQMVPNKPIFVPWESCITMGSAFSFRYDDDYKSGRDLVHLLIEIVSKGGNLALNVAPQPDGRLPRGAVKRMKELGAWLQQFGESIYGTRPVSPYYLENMAFTRKGNIVYCFVFIHTKADLNGGSLTIPYEGAVDQVELMNNGQVLSFHRVENELVVNRSDWEGEHDLPYAYVLKLTIAL
ncbi:MULTISPECIES: alpha-L-fucosidase [Bacillaceae]|uniref:alpha-L-fucosidase n=1 Tax=Alkalicoccobacillus plakortidis TaxID=444060 RepID=A0A9D5DTP0_9BACI|nr:MULTISPECIES: alpha-L-fucosidase [Bacillaceae]KQL58585.1 alpha-L-fucosidase [Alkalicoccobacillus plakortidis]